MNKKNENRLYLISGPLGVGKSTTSKLLARHVERCVLIEGDILLHMLNDDLSLSWEERLRLTWDNILALTRNYIQHDLNVVIDFVVEEELAWFCKHLSDFENVSLKYVVLKADKEKIVERLTTRGDIESLERSLFLLDKMERSDSTNPFSYDTTLKQPSETVKEIIASTRFLVPIEPI
ncbi:AAA family ATPase [Paenibacillus glycanilyticus]|uniref:AAA family ATPase n=1 Tax=Paenibacillus glycanilyticus TaxID=126569 RepID=UPI00204187B7|nr:AAA family ATPase [Paenibacillus glycanilyticus]MCM3626785.1 AAA family ATPase [Paenibacillus glycanilyticus]